MNDALRMEVLKTAQNLSRERPGDVVIELAMLEQTASNRSTRDVFNETVLGGQY